MSDTAMSAKRKVLLVGWDVADWEHINPLLDSGKLPALQRLVDRGVIGNLATLQPVLSPMLWNSITTGKQPHKHGVHGFVEPDPHSGGARAWSSQSRSTKAIWNILSQSGLKSNVINWWASHPAERINGCVVSNLITSGKPSGSGWKLPGHTVHPEEWSERLSELVMHPQEFSGEQLLPFVPKGLQIDQDNDNRVSVIARHLSEMLTTHNIATEVMESTEWDFMAVYYTAIDHFCHSFIQYHPPQLPWISDADFEMYQQVVESIYRFSDMTLHRLIELAGPEATIVLCSDHGFQSASLRLRMTPNEPAGPAYWHRKYGVFLAAGPGIKQDDRVFGATLLDITPTLLQLYGLPVGEDMDGRVLTEIFETPEPVSTIPSWDEVVSDEAGWHSEKNIPVEQDDEQLINQFAALGYITAPGDSKPLHYELAATEAKFNLARNLSWCRRFDRATELFYELVQQDPWESRFIIHLARSLITSHRYHDASRLLRQAYDFKNTAEVSAIGLWADASRGLGETEQAKNILRGLESRQTLSVGILLQIGACYLRLRQSHDARRMFGRALELQTDHAEAHLGMSTCLLKSGDNAGAAEHALASIGLIFNQARAHINFGTALLKSGNYPRAEIAFQTALKIHPESRRAHRWLSIIYSGPLLNQSLANEHAAETRRLDWAEQRRSRVSGSRPENLELNFNNIPSEEERQRILIEKRPNPVNQCQPSGKTFTIVSGLPRSGTSLMMQMLAAGGMEPKTDGQRNADADNPEGYFEWEAVKKIVNSPQLLDEEGLTKKSIKVISALLNQLPYQHHYQVIFMNRPVEEVVLSQQKMLTRRGTSGADWKPEELRQQLEIHRQHAIDWLENHPRAKVLVVEYSKLVQDPQPWTDRIAEFVGTDRLPTREKMSQSVDPELYRNRCHR